jgi:hypothetical protein
MFYNSKTPEDSKQEALTHLKLGMLGFKTYGLIRSPHLLAHAYQEKGIRLIIIAGDNIDQHVENEANAYNNIMIPEIEKKLGPDFHEPIRQRHQELKKL